MRKQFLIIFLIVVGSFLITASEYKSEKIFFIDMSEHFSYDKNYLSNAPFYSGMMKYDKKYIYIQPAETKELSVVLNKYTKEGELIETIIFEKKGIKRGGLLLDDDGYFYLYANEPEIINEKITRKYLGWKLVKLSNQGKIIWEKDLTKLPGANMLGYTSSMYFDNSENIVINHRHIISKNGEFIEYRPSRYYDGQGNFYELFGQDGFMCVSVKDKNGIEINNFKLGSTRTENNNYYITKTGNEVYFIIQDMKTRARTIRQYSVDGKILKEFDGKDTYFNKEEKTGIKMTDRKGPEESWTYENDWEKKGIWIIKKTRVGSDPYN
ncbi:MAG: hypothetical protein WC337_10655 [Candidatus Muiribacteriota bacterium]